MVLGSIFQLNYASVKTEDVERHFGKIIKIKIGAVAKQPHKKQEKRAYKVEAARFLL